MRPCDDPQGAAILLAAHPWVSAAQALTAAGRPGLIIVPTDEGLRAYRRVGHAGLSAAWESHLGASLPDSWKLAESVQEGNAESSANVTPEAQEHSSGMPEERGHVIGPEGFVQYDLRVPFELAIFRSHFPVAPIVPGVELIRWVVIFGQRHFTMPDRFAGLDMLRFRQAIQPGAQLRLDLRFIADSRVLHFTFRSSVETSSRVMSDGRILFRDADSI